MDASENFHEKLLDSLSDGVYFADRDRRILLWNKAAERITGFSRSEVVGTCCWDNVLIHVDDQGTNLCKTQCPLSATLRDGCPHEADVFLHHKDGHRLPVAVRVAPIYSPTHTIIGGVEIFSDATPKLILVERIKELEKVAWVDLLTALPNRRYTEMCLQAQLDEMARYGWPFGVLMMDLDRFKEVNDRHGHSVGDEVLRIVAKTMAAIIRPFDTVGRWGGDEFLVIIVNADRPQLGLVANRFRALIQQSTVPVGPGSVQVTLSLGATLAQPDDTAQSIVERADLMMYQSKRDGRNRVTVETPLCCSVAHT